MSTANGSVDAILLIIIIVAGAKLAYRAYLFFYRPEQYAEETRMRHERKMAATEERKAAAGRISGSILGAIVRAILGAFLKK
jgi:hypothetical protein